MKKHYYYFTKIESMLSFIDQCLESDCYDKITIVYLSDTDTYGFIIDTYRVELKYKK